MSRPIGAKYIICLLLFMFMNRSGYGGYMESKQTKTQNVADKENVNVLPGNIVFDKELLQKFKEVRKKRGDGYKPRTHHKSPDGWAEYTNRLFLESSPYLLQHAHNPVNWYPWGEEAFADARDLNRPVFVSIGYSTCHWCHVMEGESFEDLEIAAYLNENYVCIKVDREERPDVDAIYMDAVQLLTGGGGWPLNVFLTPEKQPFYGGTYFPARDGDRGVQSGFLTLLKAITDSFLNKKDVIRKTSKALTEAINNMVTPQAGDKIPGHEKLEEAVQFYKQRFDAKHGGMAGDIKFPSSLPIRFLLRYAYRSGDESVRDMALFTLDKMAEGGMYDHIGGGFHRYSTDETWLVPHFEKMLYDNALLVVAYIEAFQISSEVKYKRIAIAILDYIEKEMTSPQGGFYSATDADSLDARGHMEEGCFFTWTPEELERLLGKKRAEPFLEYFNVDGKPNFEGRYILHTSGKKVEAVAKKYRMTAEELNTWVDDSRTSLYEERKKRPLPLRDEKILTAWNGLMISAFAKAGFVFDKKRYTDIADRAATFVLNNLYHKGRLYRSYNDGRASHNAYLSDYAFFISSLIDLYESTFDVGWLEKAISLDSTLEMYYEDKKDGGFYMTSHDHEKLITRGKPSSDGAIPSGNSAAILNLLRLSELTTNSSYADRSFKALKTFLGAKNTHPAQLSEMLLALDFYLDRPKEIVIVARGTSEEAATPFISEIRKRFIPNKVLTVVQEGCVSERQVKSVPLLKGKKVIKGKVTAYVCENGSCHLPSYEPGEFSKQIGKVIPY